MKRAMLVVGLIALLTAPAAFAAQADVSKLIQEFTGQAEAVKRSQAELDAAHAAVLDELVPKMGSANAGDRAQACTTYERIALRAGRPGAEAERLAACKAMAARIAPPTPLEARKWMLRLLENVGKDEAVAAIAAQLGAKEAIIRERARRALQHNPSPKATAALQAALAKAKDPAWRVALINALAYRPADATVKALVPQAKDADEAVRTAAVEALGRLGSKQAADVIAAARTQGSPRARKIATDNYLLLADKLCAKADKASALAIYRKLLGEKGHLKCAALIGLGRAGGVRELDTIFGAMNDPDPKVRGAALGALEMLPTADVIAALQSQLKVAKPELKVLLLRALATRADKASLPAFTAAAKDASEAVRIEAIEGMARIGDERAGPTLVAALLKAKGAELGTVRRALVRIPGQRVSQALVKAMASADAAGKVEIIRALVDRRSPTIVADLMNAATDADAKVRAEALKGIGALAEAPALSDLLKMLVNAKADGDRAAIEKAIVAVCRRLDDADRCAAPVIAAYAGAGAAAKGSLIRVLGRIRGAKALAQVRSAAKDPSADIQDAAVRALAAWGDPAVADDLIAIAKGSPSQVHRILALRGFVKVVSLVRGRSQDDMLKLYESAMAAARRPADKKMVLSGLAQVRNLAALRMVERYRADPALKNEALAASVKIASALGGSHPAAALAALKQVGSLTKDARLIRQANDAINMIQRFADYIVSWEVSGPYTNPKGGKSVFNYAFPPEQKNAQGVKWQPMRVGTDPKRPWYIELDKMFGGSNRAAYLRTRVFSPNKQRARMELGSDDGAKLWINGKLVHSNPAQRPCRPGQDKKPITLEKGWNRVLFKVQQGGGQWAACLRFRTPKGGKLEGLRAQVDGE